MYIPPRNEIKAQALRVKNFKEGSLPDNDPILAKPTSDAHKKEIEAEKEGLRSLFKRETKDWNKLRKVAIAAKDGASIFNLIVKFTFVFDEPHHSDDIARYCTVLDWVHAQFAKAAPADSQTVFDKIKAAGGFEKVLVIQRDAKNQADNDADRKLMSAAIRQDIKSMLATATPLGTIAMETRFAQEGIVVMIGRKRAFVEGQPEQVDLISEIELTEAEMTTAIESYGANTNIPNSSNSEFVAQLLDLGALVPEGLPTQTSRDGTQSGENAKTQRVVSFRPALGGAAEFVVSARGADVSPVIYVRPREVANLGEPQSTLMLGAEPRRRMEHLLRDRNVRRHIAITADDNPVRKDGTEAKSPISWLTGNDVLLEKSSENATQQFYWTDMASTDHKPLDVENFNPQFSTAIDDLDVSLIVSGPVKKWEESTSPTKQKAVFTLTVDGGQLTVLTAETDPHVYKLSAPVAVRCTLSVRAKDVVAVFNLLAQQNAAQFHLEGDEGGLLRISWADRLGHYTINMPTATREGGWISRRVAPMRVAATELIAAE